MKTDAATPPEHLEKALEPYDVIADVYAALQGSAPPTSTRSSGRGRRGERSDGLFVYFIEFSVIFEDETAEGDIVQGHLTKKAGETPLFSLDFLSWVHFDGRLPVGHHAGD